MQQNSEQLAPDELLSAWPLLDDEDRVGGFRMLGQQDAEDLFLHLDTGAAADLILALPGSERRLWIRLLPPDDAADLIQAVPAEQREALLTLLDDATRGEVNALLAYAEDEAGGLMNPRYARLRPEMSVDEAIRYLRRQSRTSAETVYYAYVVDHAQHLLGVVSFRQLVTAPPEKTVGDIMARELVKIPEEMDQEAVSHIFADHGYLALPVVDSEGRMKGIVTADDIVDVVKEEATEDIQKIGGTAALDAPYLEVGRREMFQKRVGWLAVLFVGQMLTASVIGYFQTQLEVATVLTLFIPLIISSGGNSGSQASTLVIRAMALGEVRLRDWWRIMQRELVVGALLGAFLGLMGLARVFVWKHLFGVYGEHFFRLGLTVCGSVIGVVLWGTLSGSMLPLLLRRLGFDPASASTPFVATLCDVIGLVIYFGIAHAILSGTMLP
ncbi:Magnesium transporter MgtE [Phycisphaerae bacterium RAS1]|nr:Magnesium transporter MgtE [Phycisphaerae bacterium RAS1]